MQNKIQSKSINLPLISASGGGNKKVNLKYLDKRGGNQKRYREGSP